MQSLTLKTGVEILLSDLKVDTYVEGPVGAWSNKQENGIQITHIPSGYTTRCHSKRGQHQNRVLAIARMINKLEAEHWKPVVFGYDINPFPHGQL